jgi:hypothetical protein
MKWLFLLLLVIGYSNAEILDRVAIAVGYETITELQLDEELRVTALLNHKSVVRDAEARRDAADRLIQQFLIEREMQVSRYPLPDPKEVERYVDQVANTFGDKASLERSLTQYQLSYNTLVHHLLMQLATLRFIENRFRPEVTVSDTEVDAFLKAEQRPGNTQSSPNNREQVREQLMEKQTDETLAVWLEEARKRFNIIYLDKSLQ